jgi:hypothetical protein
MSRNHSFLCYLCKDGEASGECSKRKLNFFTNPVQDCSDYEPEKYKGATGLRTGNIHILRNMTP